MESIQLRSVYLNAAVMAGYTIAADRQILTTFVGSGAQGHTQIGHYQHTQHHTARNRPNGAAGGSLLLAGSHDQRYELLGPVAVLPVLLLEGRQQYVTLQAAAQVVVHQAHRQHEQGRGQGAERKAHAGEEQHVRGVDGVLDDAVGPCRHQL
jgi:hypothetical protein